MRHTANRLTGMAQNGQTVNYRYNGLGDRLVEGETEFEMDLNTGLTQVLADGTNTYMYGNGRIGQFTGVESAYFLGDALGSVRQLVNEGGVLMITKNYEPYGEVIKSQGSGASKYGFAGEQVDRMELIYLRARYYSSDSGRFITRDTWEGNDLIPISYNAWLYGYSNPMSFSDPSGKCPVGTENVGNGICEPVDGPVPQKPGDNSPLPPTEGYDPTQPPQEGISWVPFVDPLRAGAPGLPKNKNGAQNSVPGWEGTKNLCGLVSLAAIFHAYDSQITTSDLVSKFDYWRHHLAPNKDWAPKGPGYQGIDELVNFVNYRYYPHWIARKYALGADLGITIKTRLLQHQYMIVGVVLDPDNGRLKTVRKEGYADHWVVVTGISKQYIKWGNTSSKNWVRIFDPYRNQTMYYWYSDFLRTKELNSAYLFVTHSNDLRIPNYPCRPN